MAETSKAENKHHAVSEGTFTIDGVAELMSVHRSTIERLLQSRKLGYFQVGRRRLIGRQHLKDYLSQVERRAQSEL